MGISDIKLFLIMKKFLIIYISKLCLFTLKIYLVGAVIIITEKSLYLYNRALLQNHPKYRNS